MKKQNRIILCSLIAVSIIACVIVGAFRINVENNYKNVQIALRYTDVLSIAEQTKTSVESVLREFKDLGATTLFVRENTVLPAVKGDFSNYKEQGEVTVFDGYLMKGFYKDTLDIKPQLNYIVTGNEQIANTIYQEFLLKNIAVKQFASEGSYFIEVGDFTNALSTVGVGFNNEDLDIAANLGYTISPQVRGWSVPSKESIAFLIDNLRSIKNLGAVYFADAEIPGAASEEMAAFISEGQLGFVEFFSNKQKGFSTLAKKSSDQGKTFRVMRLHTLTDEEVKKYKPQEIMDRYGLALRERNLRTFLFKMANTTNVIKDVEDLKTNLTNFKNMAEKHGYVVTGEMQNYNVRTGNYILSLLAGIAAIAVFVFLLDLLGFTTLGYILGGVAFIGYAGLLKLSPSVGLRAMAFFGAVIFPTYAVASVIDEKPRKFKETLTAFLKVSIISFGGALTIIGTLSRTSFGLGIDVFSGVKIAHIVPILFVLGIAIYKKHGFDVAYYKKMLTGRVSYLAIGVIGVVAVALFIYITRTGNNGGVTDLELKFRKLLDNTLGVRPRTKEFLIGYPILVSMLHFGYKEKYLPFLVFAAIGPVSLINTHAHVHTPILVSLIRSGYGIVIGFILGLITIQVLKLIVKVMKKWKILEK